MRFANRFADVIRDLFGHNDPQDSQLPLLDTLEPRMLLNADPTATSDLLATNEGTALVITISSDLLANDSDPDQGDTLSLDSFTQPEYGELVDNEDGTLTFTPDCQFIGSDVFTYTITDGNGGYDTATGTVQVMPDWLLGLEVDHVDPGAALTGYTANDILITIDGKWTGAQLSTGDLGDDAIYQDSNWPMNKPPIVPPYDPYDTFISNGGLTYTTSGGIMEVGDPVNLNSNSSAFSDSQINYAWSPSTSAVPTDPTDYVIARLTLDDTVDGEVDLLVSSNDGDFVIFTGAIVDGQLNFLPDSYQEAMSGGGGASSSLSIGSVSVAKNEGGGGGMLESSGDIIVNTINDEEYGHFDEFAGISLRQAIFEANSDPGESNIVFNFDEGEGPIILTLKYGELSITHPVTIQWTGSRELIIDADPDNDPTTSQSRIFNISSSTSDFKVSIKSEYSNKLKLTGGVNTQGAAIYNTEELEIENVLFDDNGYLSYYYVYGGAIYNTGILNVQGSTFTNNKADQGGAIYTSGSSGKGSLDIKSSILSNNSTLHSNYNNHGGGIYAEDVNGQYSIMISEDTEISNNKSNGNGGGLYADECAVIINKSDIVDNVADLTQSFGGGIYCTNGTLQILSGSTIDNNRAGRSGGGILAGYNDSVLIEDSTISNNKSITESGGGISISNYANDTATINRTTITGNEAGASGGGIYAGCDDITIKNCYITNNHATGTDTYDVAGGISNGYTHPTAQHMKVINSVIVGNTTPTTGGGIHSWESAEDLIIINCTIAGNWAGQDNGGVGGNATLYNTIIYLNETENGETDNFGGSYDDEINLVDTDPGFVRNPTLGSDLGDLHLTSSSTAIDAGNNTYAVDENGATLVLDLDNHMRRVIGKTNNNVDIGAYEYKSSRLGDFNADGSIEAADLALLLGNWGSSTRPAEWTSNWDGFVDANELAALLENWGQGLE